MQGCKPLETGDVTASAMTLYPKRFYRLDQSEGIENFKLFVRVLFIMLSDMSTLFGL